MRGLEREMLRGRASMEAMKCDRGPCLEWQYRLLTGEGPLRQCGEREITWECLLHPIMTASWALEMEYFW
jgi:hypothetical protein